tara:strand:+ start:2993 stop:3745 length:753 start_codon:yes stop_codon:yes gene_type:complete
MENSRIVVIVPTFNEANNLPVLAERIFAQNICDLDILIVDDNSPDGTADCARQLSENYNDNIYVLDLPEKLGLSNAYKQGFNWAISQKYDILVQMDADLSHNPNYIRHMIDKLSDYDVVVGSRYILKGAVSNKWSFLRRFISFLGNFGIRNILIINVRDITSGFKAFKYQSARSINWDQIYCAGFGFQAEITYQCYKFGYSIFEIPIIFEDRLYGKSKMTFVILLETLLKIIIFKLFQSSRLKKPHISNP